jgi:hypothetical protein
MNHLAVVQLDGKEARALMQQAAANVDRIKRSSFPNIIYSDCEGRTVFRHPIMEQHI